MHVLLTKCLIRHNNNDQCIFKPNGFYNFFKSIKSPLVQKSLESIIKKRRKRHTFGRKIKVLCITDI